MKTVYPHRIVDDHMRGIMAVDPGGRTGVAWGVFDVSAKNVSDALANRIHSGSCTFEGPEEKQVLLIANLWRDFYRACVRNFISPAYVELVFEDFVLRPGQHGGGKEGISPVHITWGIIGYRMGAAAEYERSGWGPTSVPPIILQLAGQASTYATPRRLKEWGIWVVGREHERSAWRHVALRLATISQQQ